MIFINKVTLEDETNVRTHESLASQATQLPLYESEHWDRYPHQPGTLYDCPDCESQCFCDDMGLCLFCEIQAAPSAEYREEC